MSDMDRHEGQGVARGGGGQAGTQGRAWSELGVRLVRVPRYRLVRWLSIFFWLIVLAAVVAEWLRLAGGV